MNANDFVMHTDPRYSRPHITIYGGLSALVDTGADMPLCFLPMESIVNDLGGRCILESVSVNGVNHEIFGDEYLIPHFEFGNLIYPNLKMLVPYVESGNNRSYHFIISSSMLYGLDYEFRTAANLFYVHIPTGQSNIQNTHIVNDGVDYILSNAENGE